MVLEQLDTQCTKKKKDTLTILQILCKNDLKIVHRPNVKHKVIRILKEDKGEYH